MNNKLFVQVPFHGELLVISVQTSGEWLRRKHIEKALEWLRETAKDADDQKEATAETSEVGSEVQPEEGN